MIPLFPIFFPPITLAVLPNSSWRGLVSEIYMDHAFISCRSLIKYHLIVKAYLYHFIGEGNGNLLQYSGVSHGWRRDWKVPWTEEPGRLQSTGSQRVGHDWVTSLSLYHLIENDFSHLWFFSSTALIAHKLFIT